MTDLEIILTVVSIIGGICAIVFGVVAVVRGKKQDKQADNERYAADAVDIASIKIDVKYTRDGIARIDRRLDDYEKNQNKMSEKIAVIEEHMSRVDGRLDKLEKRNIKKGE